ncbi:MAG: S9 family peptidase [Candidatus Aminicenantes bacterium]|nr:S9 family peptidase [Candidatus Aminicenantes bacterium]
MKKQRILAQTIIWILALFLILGSLTESASAQDRLKTYPGYESFQKMSQEIRGAVESGTLRITWAEDGKSFEYNWDGKKWQFDLKTGKAASIGEVESSQDSAGRRTGGPARGRQFTEAESPDGKLKAFYRDSNLWLSDADGQNEFAVTTDGNKKDRTKYASASWVYGEELGQNTAMWWSPDSGKIAFYRFDESPVSDYFLQLDQTKLYSSSDIEAYPKSGEPNPVAEMFVYNLASKAVVKLDVRDGNPFENSVVGHYVYRVSWSSDGTEILFNRTNRRQNILEFCAADPATGKVRIILHEEWPTGWVKNSPEISWLEDGRRFIWASERTGFNNYYLYDISGQLLATLTSHPFEVARIIKVDEKAKALWYTARDGDNWMKIQLHRVGLDGKKDVRLTDPSLNHSADISPDGKFFIDVAQAHNVPPTTQLMDAKGKTIAVLAESNTAKFEELGLKKAELLQFRAADDSCDLYGMLQFPSDFDPSKSYPLLVSVYAGPGWNGARETFAMPNSLTEFGFLVASFDTRGSSGRGKRAMDSIYMQLGVVEMDDQASGVRSLWDRPYLDKKRVGIFGTSYGGYASAMCLLRHPDVFAAASASSAVTAWYHYDSIYTERYMWIPQENKEGYEAGNAMMYADKLDGRLMIYYGTADNNVHPNNAMQLIQALQKAGKNFEVMVGPDAGHSGINRDRMMEFFIENLVLNPSKK